MGELRFTEFCKNGHITNFVPHDCVDYSDDVLECPYCGVKEFANVFGYKTSFKLIGYEWYGVNNNWFKGKKKIAIYDVSKIKNWSTKRLPGECKNCYTIRLGDDDCRSCETKERRLQFGSELIILN